MSAWDELDTWVRTVWGQCSGYLEVTRITPGKGLKASHQLLVDWDTTSAIQIAELTNLYLGCCTVKEPPKGRGTYEERYEMPGLWLDMDIGTVGHAEVANQKPRFESPEHALKILKEYGFPEPSGVVHSGGGLYPWWLFREPLVLEPSERRDAAQVLSNKWHRRASRVADEHGYFQDELADLPRFLRPPGTWNFKEGQRRATGLLKLEPDLRYDPNDLWAMVADERVGPIKFSQDSAFERTGVAGGDGLADVLRGCSWAEILVPAGWEFLGISGDDEEWRRPGAIEEKRSALCARDTMTVFSAGAQVPSGTGKGLTKWRVFCHLWFKDPAAPATGTDADVDWRAAKSDLSRAVSGGDSVAPWPVEAVERACQVVGLDLDWVKDRMDPQTREELELVRKGRKKIITRDAAGQTWSTLR